MSVAGHHFLMLGAIAGILVAVFWDSFSSIFALWWQGSHRHGLLVLPICAWLVWRQRGSIDALTARPSLFGMLLVSVLVLVWLVAKLVGVQLLEHVAVIGLLPATVLAVAGFPVVRQLGFAFLFLVWAVPVGDSLVPQMMTWTADLASTLLRYSGVPVLRSGQTISLPNGDFVIAEVCSGVRYFMSGMMVAMIFAMLNYSRLRKQIAFLGIVSVLLVLANGLRAFVIMYVANATNGRYLAGEDHVQFGWLLFGITILAILWLGSRYADSDAKQNDIQAMDRKPEGLPVVALMTLVAVVVTLQPFDSKGMKGLQVGLVLILTMTAVIAVIRGRGVNRPQAGVPGTGHRTLRSVGLVTLLLVAGPAAFAAIEAGENRQVLIPGTADLDNCEIVGQWTQSWTPEMYGAAVQKGFGVACDGTRVDLYYSAYAGAGQDAELVGHRNRPIPKAWKRRIRAPGAEQSPVLEAISEQDGSVIVAWYWYVVDDRTAVRPVQVKSLQLRAILRGRPSGGYVVVAVAGAESPISARESLARLHKAKGLQTGTPL